MHFEKYHGLGNDVLILDSDHGWTQEVLNAKLVKKLSDRKTGIGCDQVMMVKKVDLAGVDAEIGISNADGSSAEACGNGTR